MQKRQRGEYVRVPRGWQARPIADMLHEMSGEVAEPLAARAEDEARNEEDDRDNAGGEDEGEEEDEEEHYGDEEDADEKYLSSSMSSGRRGERPRPPAVAAAAAAAAKTVDSEGNELRLWSGALDWTRDVDAPGAAHRVAYLRLAKGEYLCLRGDYTVRVSPPGAARTPAAARPQCPPPLLLNGVRVVQGRTRISAVPWHCLPVLQLPGDGAADEVTLAIEATAASDSTRRGAGADGGNDVPAVAPVSADDVRRGAAVPHVVPHAALKRIARAVAGNDAGTATTATAAAHRARPPVIMVCGGRGSGKSTLTMQLVMHLLPQPQAGGDRPAPACAVRYLDLDVGQSMFMPPGYIAAHDVDEVAWPLRPSRLHRAMFYGYVSPLSDPARYVSAVRDMARHCGLAPDEGDGAGRASQRPLIVNTLGWYRGFGRTLLHAVAHAIQPTHIVHLGATAGDKARVRLPCRPWRLPPTTATTAADAATSSAGADADAGAATEGDRRNLYVCGAELSFARPNRARVASAADVRGAQLVAHLLGGDDELRYRLHDGQPAYRVARALCAARPWCIRLCDLDAVHFLDHDVDDLRNDEPEEEPEEEQGGGVVVKARRHERHSLVLSALNGVAVAMCEKRGRGGRHCCISDDHDHDHNDGGADDRHWISHGMGVVRATDPRDHVLFIITPLPRELVERVSVLVVSAQVQLPACALQVGSADAEPFLAPNKSMEADNAMRSRQNLRRKRLDSSSSSQQQQQST